MLRVVHTLVWLAGWVMAGPVADLASRLSHAWGASVVDSASFVQTVAKCPAKQDVKSLQCLQKVLYSQKALQFSDQALHSPSQLLPLSAWRSGRGACVSLSFLALWGAEILQLPVQIQVLPGHVFLRFNLHNAVNWEPNRQGYAYQDSEYIAKYQLSAQQGRVRQVIGLSQFEGLLYYEAGNVDMQYQQYSDALHKYTLAKSLWNEERVVGAYALALLRVQNRTVAIQVLDSLWNAQSHSAELAYNRIIAYAQNGATHAELQNLWRAAQQRGIQSPMLSSLQAKLFP